MTKKRKKKKRRSRRKETIPGWTSTLGWYTRRKGIPWPSKCEGPGPFQHVKDCNPRRPRCKWRRAEHEKWKTCTCGIPHFHHRRGSVCWKPEIAGACLYHPESDRINFEIINLRDFDTGEPLDHTEINSERYE